MILALLFSHPESPDVWHGNRSQLSRLLIGQIQVIQPSFFVMFSYWSQAVLQNLVMMYTMDGNVQMSCILQYLSAIFKLIQTFASLE